ncbi:thermonuclease family protein [Pararhizobium haloflavum]|uniref:thermonuclease family protein n=1 Tax=Pararhizobium haloflavum TaxID=2037914 RepID=UPI000C173CB3|nr:thermonuclease family protein [Pararhizobium haloflavum]
MIGRFLRSLVLPTVLIVVLLAGLITAMDYYAALEERPASADRANSAPPAETADSAAAVDRRDDRSAASRPVDPQLFGQPFTARPGELTRVDPRPPLTPPKEETDEEAASTMLYRPQAVGAGRLEFEGRALQLAGIDPTPVERTCQGESGAWPCGMVARTAFRNYLRSRALECDVPADDWQDTAVATCMMRDDDIAAWLVRNGWAEATAGSAYAELASKAREEGRGIYGGDPRR